MNLIKLIIYLILISFIHSAVSGIIMFFIDMIRFGTPHKRFEAVSSIEKYNERMAQNEKKYEAEASDQNVSASDPIEIDL